LIFPYATLRMPDTKKLHGDFCELSVRFTAEPRIMRRSVTALILAFGLAIGQIVTATAPQEDPLLTEYYYGDEKILCRDYQTANGARWATYQWWVLGFVSGADHAQSTGKRPGARANVARVLKLASDYCSAHPTDRLAAAAVAVVDQLGSAQSGK
jgi:hypothetical protein